MAAPCRSSLASPRLCGRLAVGLAALLLAGSPAAGDEVVTDANVVSGLDLSESVSGADLRLQVEGMARALRSPAFLSAVARGGSGRIGFAIFAWYHGHFPLVVPWRLIASADDAEEAARALEALAAADVHAEAVARDRFYAGRLTNLARAMDHAGELLDAAPFHSGRRVVNMVGDGVDNVGGVVSDARDRLVASGVTVNGVVIGDDSGLLDYYRREVSGGDGAFVMAATAPDLVVEVMLRKFLRDLIASGEAGPTRTLR